ncbi:MAG: MurR/RpiR family transcriptional regulator [Loktanella sp.]|nr:MurR/RpiR family transcriptional regulator [Loktanella sp.]
MSQFAEPTTAPETVAEALARMDAIAETLPKRLKQCATFTRHHLHLIAVSTVSEMAQAADVAPSAFMRFCQAMGFSGYSDMQALFRTQFTSFRPDYDTRLAQLRPSVGADAGRLMMDFAESGHKSLLSLTGSVTSESMNGAAKAMAEARIVHLIGLRRAYAVAVNMAYYFGKLEVPCVLHASVGLQDLAPVICKDDVLFAITFAPFSEETIKLARRAANNGARVIGLTDSETCPLSSFADDVLLVRENEVGGFRALNGAITLSTALSVAVGAVKNTD